MTAAVVISGLPPRVVKAQQTGLQGPPGPAVAAGAAGQFYVTNAAGTAPQWATISGDASADVVTVGKLTVTGLQGRALSAAAPNAGNTLGWNGATWAPSALNLAGGAAYVTGVLPTANQAAQAMAGDVTGTTAASVVAKANGASVPAAGGLTPGNVLQVSGVSALSYGPVNLAGGANYVTGVLPTANVGNPAGEVTGTQAATVVSGPFSTASLLWTNAVSTGTLGTNKASAVLALSADTNVVVATLKKVGSTSSSVIFSSPGLATAATINLNDNGAVYIGAGALATNYILFNGSSGNTFTTYNGSNQVFMDNGAVVYATLTGTGGLVLKGSSTTPFVQGDTTSTSLTLGTNKAGATLVLQADAASTALTLAGTTAVTASIGSPATSFQINWSVAAAANGGATSIVGQAAGGTNDGGAIVFQGGSHAGASTVDGSVKINTPLNPGFVSVAAAAPTNLNNAQSNANVLILTGAIGGPFTVNVLRRISDTSLMVIRNNTNITATIAYLTGGTVTIATNTSAVICSDGANLQKVVIGT